MSVETWQDIWINEGFATSVVVAYPPPGAPPIGQLFGASVYERGGLTFAALHARLGDETFFAVMRTYIE